MVIGAHVCGPRQLTNYQQLVQKPRSTDDRQYNGRQTPRAS